MEELEKRIREIIESMMEETTKERSIEELFTIHDDFGKSEELFNKDKIIKKKKKD